jgi:peptidoglycan/LPS O-acetylase OafA/YrhL
MKPTYRPDIDGLRAFAILAVFACHAFPMVLPGGFCGVDVFFVISGYLIASNLYRDLEAGTFRLADFYARRVRRLFPALLVLLPLCLLAGWVMLLPAEFQQLGINTAAGTVFLQNILLSRETGYFGTGSDFIPLLHLWSLAVEEQFYILFPLLLVACWKWKISLAWTLGALMAASLAWSVAATGASAGPSFYFTHIRAWEFLAGTLLALSHLRGTLSQSPRFAAWLATGGTVVLALSFAFITEQAPYPGWRAVFPVLGAVLLIAAGSENCVSRIVYSSRPIVWIGLISYPLYLFHWPILSFARIVSGGPVSVRFTLGAIALSFVLAAAVYYLVEQKWRHARSRWTVPGLAAAFVIVGLAGLAVAGGWVSPRSDRAEIAPVLAAMKEKEWNPQLPGVRKKSDYYEIGRDRALTLFAGDSFCGQYLPRAAEVLTKNTEPLGGVMMLFQRGIPPVPGVRRGSGDAGHRLTERILEIVDIKPEIDRVVIAACWPFYFEEAQSYEIDKLPLSTEAGRLAALSSLKAFLEALGSLGKKVAVVLDPPWDYRLAPERFLKRSFFGVTLAPPPSVSYQDFLNRGSYSVGLLREDIKALCQEAGVEVIDPADELVVNGICVVVDENGPIRSDMSHLRASFVRENVKYLDRFLRCSVFEDGSKKNE